MFAILQSARFRRFIAFAVVFALGLYFYSILDGPLMLTRLNQQSIQAEERIQWWNWNDTPEELFCRSSHELIGSKDRIPNVVHFVLLAEEGKQADLSYSHFLAIKAAVVRMNATEIKVHTYGLDEQNPWWEQIKDHVTLLKIDRNTIAGPHGLPLGSLHLAHQSDIIRMDVIMREGGIYLDTDVYALKPFTDLLSSSRDTIMGHEGGNRYGLCNAVIISRPHSEFMTIWQETYATFDPDRWNDHSVLMPKQLQVQHHDLICPLSPTVFFWPTWARAHVHYMHDPIAADEAAELRANMTAFEGAMYDNQLAFHAVAAKEYLSLLTPENIQEQDTRFNILVRDIAAAPLVRA